MWYCGNLREVSCCRYGSKQAAFKPFEDAQNTRQTPDGKHIFHKVEDDN